MPNIDSPRGFRWVGGVGGHKKPRMQRFPVAAAQTLYKNQPVEFDATGNLIDPASATQLATAGSPGVSVGYITTAAGEVDKFMDVILWAGQLFEVNYGSTAALQTLAAIETDISDGDFFTVHALTSGVSGLNISAAEIQGAGTGTASNTACMQIVDYRENPNNQPGENVNVIVRAWEDIISLGHRVYNS